MTTNDTPDGSRAATNVAEFIADLDGGQTERMLSIALSQVAAAVIDRDRKGEVSLVLKVERIEGTHQVRIEHTTKYSKPTVLGKQSEEASGATVMHVGRFGRLSIAQPSLLDEGRQSRLPE